MANESIFYQFCKHVDENIFSDENKGEVVAFVVDQTFINDFCKEYHTTEDKLLYDARRHLLCVTLDPLCARGMIALQVFAATKRANSDGITERNYNERLVDLLFIDLGDLQRWYADYQDAMWSNFYDWCDAHGFLISRKCYPFFGPGRYVQYPIQEALRVFTTEALLNFARAFVDNGLTPNDDCSFKTFWEIVSWRSLSSYIDSSNAKRIYYDSKFYDDARQQIYNFFLRWNGEYREANNSNRKKTVSTQGNCLYLSNDYKTLEIRDNSQKLISSYSVSSTKYKLLTNSKNRLPIRRAGIFVFRKDTMYDVWEEVMCLEEGEDGVAVVFPNYSNFSFAFINCKVLIVTPYLKVYRLANKSGPAFCFTEKRKCYLDGGLKIGRNQYLVGAAPFLIREELGLVRIDKEEPYSNDNRISLNYLKAGSHVVSIQGRKPIRFELIDPFIYSPEWNSDFSQWDIQKKGSIWRTASVNNGVSGMNLSALCKDNLQENEDSPLKAWAKINNGMNAHSSNIVIQTLTNIRDYEEL